MDSGSSKSIILNDVQRVCPNTFFNVPKIIFVALYSFNYEVFCFTAMEEKYSVKGGITLELYFRVAFGGDGN